MPVQAQWKTLKGRLEWLAAQVGAPSVRALTLAADLSPSTLHNAAQRELQVGKVPAFKGDTLPKMFEKFGVRSEWLSRGLGDPGDLKPLSESEATQFGAIGRKFDVLGEARAFREMRDSAVEFLIRERQVHHREAIRAVERLETYRWEEHPLSPQRIGMVALAAHEADRAFIAANPVLPASDDASVAVGDGVDDSRSKTVPAHRPNTLAKKHKKSLKSGKAPPSGHAKARDD